MNIIAVMNHLGVYFKEEPVRQLHNALEEKGFLWFIQITVTTYYACWKIMPGFAVLSLTGTLIILACVRISVKLMIIFPCMLLPITIRHSMSA